MSKVRIYDLAKELKLESKKILEDARRMGVDVSVPSNTLEDNIAAKIREMYYPKKEQAPAIHKARLIKHQITPGSTAERRDLGLFSGPWAVYMRRNIRFPGAMVEAAYP